MTTALRNLSSNLIQVFMILSKALGGGFFRSSRFEHYHNYGCIGKLYGITVGDWKIDPCSDA
jgi:hypothetical protein